jgi:hypothetical protein
MTKAEKKTDQGPGGDGLMDGWMDGWIERHTSRRPGCEKDADGSHIAGMLLGDRLDRMARSTGASFVMRAVPVVCPEFKLRLPCPRVEGRLHGLRITMPRVKGNI